MERICFILKLRPECIEEYVERHINVWPEMQAALQETGWGNYTIFLASGGLLIGYMETKDFDEARRRMKALCINDQWQAEMVPHFDLSGEHADDSMLPLQQVFRLD
ncbi:MAG: L-rhamnose mutarotase [Acidobacteriota bacterium]|nr:L-rhamnose mutarotase [Acidobacteriota bacterium]